jgi:hypothetical protein
MTIQELEAEAKKIALQSRGAETKEQAFARLLDSDPEAYATFRAQHNAAPMVAALEAAGVKIRR